MEKKHFFKDKLRIYYCIGRKGKMLKKSKVTFQVVYFLLFITFSRKKITDKKKRR